MNNINNIKKERDDTMAAISKPVTGAFVLDSNKASDFFTKKAFSSADALRRFNRKSKVDKITSVKK